MTHYIRVKEAYLNFEEQKFSFLYFYNGKIYTYNLRYQLLKIVI